MNDMTITDVQLLEIQNGVEEISGNASISEDQLHALIGKSLFHDNTMELTPEGSKKMLRHVLSKKEFLSQGATTISSDAAIENGKHFWQRFKEHAKEDICSNPHIKEFFDTKDSLKESVKSLLCIILPAIGVAIASAFLTGIIVALIVLMIREGYKTFCAV